jgi:hypothetical protein
MTMPTKKKKTVVKKDAKAKKPALECPPEKESIDIEAVALVLASPDYTTQKKQAKALGVVDRTLRRWLAKEPGIVQRALEIKREASAAGMITGYRRLEGIIAKGSAKNCIAAIKLLAQLRGDLVEKREFTGTVTVNDPRLNALLDGADENDLRGLISGGTGSARPGGRGGAGKARGK